MTGDEVTVREEPQSLATQTFELMNRRAKALAMSGLMPKDYSGPSQEAAAKCLVAAEMAERMRMTPVAVAQNLHMIQGRPSWSSSFVIAAINHCGILKGSLRFRMVKKGETVVAPVTYTQTYYQNGQKKTKNVTVDNAPDWECFAEGTCVETGEILTGPTITTTMAILEGWYEKPGSKWKTMIELMIQYRAGAFFGRLYAPEVLAGLHNDDEVRDMAPLRVAEEVEDLTERLEAMVTEGEIVEPEPPDEGEDPQGDLGFDPNDDLPDDLK